MLLAHKIALDPNRAQRHRRSGSSAPGAPGYEWFPRTACAASLTCGRRAGKSFVLALIAAYLAISKDWGPLSRPRYLYGLHKSFYGTIVI